MSPEVHASIVTVAGEWALSFYNSRKTESEADPMEEIMLFFETV